MLIDRDQIVECGIGDDTKAGAEAKSVLKTAGDDVVGNAHINQIRQLITGRSLAGRKANRTRITADNGCNAGGKP